MGAFYTIKPVTAPSLSHTICSTSAIESLDARHRRAVKARGHFPPERVAHPGSRSPSPTGPGVRAVGASWL
jgi:hypothetical protein